MSVICLWVTGSNQVASWWRVKVDEVQEEEDVDYMYLVEF